MKHRYHKWLAGLLVLSIATFGCSQAKYEAASDDANNDNQKSGDPVDYKGRPACEVHYWDQGIDLNLYSFEFLSSNGINLGFNAGGLIKAIGLDVKIDKAKLFMNVSPSNVYEREKDFLSSASETDVSLGVNINFGQIGVGFEHYSKTPVAQLTRKGLMSSIEGLRGKVFALPKYKEWSTRVLRTPVESRDKIVIQAGADAGITEGDQFEVYNITHKWFDKNLPCESRYMGYEYDDEKPVAIVRAGKGVQSARQFATLTITDPRISNVEILPGAYVRQVPAAKGKKLKALARSIKINSITSGNLILTNGQKIDLPGYMKKQISDVLQDKKWKGQYYLYQE